MNALTRLGALLLVASSFYTAPAQAAAAELVFHVTTTLDQVDAHPLDGRCATASGSCSLRAAIMEATFHPGRHATIVLSAGRFVITRPPTLKPINANPSLNGPFMLLSSMTIRGAGQGATVIDGNQLDRIFTIAPPWITVSISDLTLTGGVARERELLVVTGGGAIANQGHLVLHRVTVAGNRADYGGGVFNTPTSWAEIYDSRIVDNVANLEGGGIRFDARGTVSGSTIARNRVLAACCTKLNFDGSPYGEGGGIDTRGAGAVTIDSSRIVDNHAVTGGGGVNAATGYQGNPLGLLPSFGGVVTIRNSLVSGNTSDAGPANCMSTVAPLRSLGGNTSDDASCPFTAAGDRLV